MAAMMNIKFQNIVVEILIENFNKVAWGFFVWLLLNQHIYFVFLKVFFFSFTTFLI